MEAIEAQADDQRYQLEATYLSLTANVVTSAIADASPLAQIEATNDIIKSEQEQLTLIQRQFELGAVAQSDVLSQQSNLAQTQATLPPLQKQLAQQRNQLMAYLGRLPGEDRGEHRHAVHALRGAGGLRVHRPKSSPRDRKSPETEASTCSC